MVPEAGVSATAGLHAFAAEGASAEHAVDPAPAVSSDTRLRRLVVLLAALVVVEAVPAALWVHKVFVSRAAAISPAAVQPQPPAPVLMATAPCDSAPSLPSEPEPATSTSTAASPVNAPAARPGPSSGGADAAPGLIAGLVSIAAPVPMHVFANGRLVGTTEADSIMLPVGKHDLEFVSEAAAYRARRTVSVQAGRATKVALETPSGTVHVNATPWAEVVVDNRPVGETPIGNLKLPIGNREFVFRHPEFGEHRTTVLVTLKETARVSVDMRKK
jgi:hypothetical protein